RQPRLELTAADMCHRCRHFQAAEVRALEADAVVRRCRLERKSDLVAGMKSDSGAGHGTTKSSLRLQWTSLLGPGKPTIAEQSGCQRSPGPIDTDKRFVVCYLRG